ncbi:hypothetical protein K8T06_08895, partial [bacterium]|nr:hypothetical protein [bacterium]
MNNIEKSKVFRSILLILCVIFMSVQIQAQTWTTYTNASYVGGMAAHGTGFWAGTDGGILDWDVPSDTYVKYTTSEGLADQSTKEVFIDSSNDLWVGTKEGVQHFDGVTWTTYTTSNSPLPNNLVYSIVQDLSGDMWFGTDFGCARFDGTTWDVYTDLGGGATNVAVRGIGVDSLNQIWTANNPDNYGDPGGVSMFDGTTWTRHDPETSGIGQYYLSLNVDDSDNIWAGSWTKHVYMYDGSVWTHYDTGNSGLVGNNIEAIEVDAAGTVWIGNHNASYSDVTNGLAKYDGSTWTTYTTANSGLPGSHIYSLSTNGGTLFIGTKIHGSASFDGTSWDYFVTSNEPHVNNITSIDKGVVGMNPAGMYFGSAYYGVVKFINGNWSSYNSYNSGLGDDSINDIRIHGGDLLVGAQYTGLWEFDGTSWTNYNTGNSGLLGDIIVSVDVDSSGTYWLGTSGWSGPMGQDGALSKFDGSTWTNYYLSNSSLIDDDHLRVSVDSSDIIWIGTEEGISRFDGGSGWTSYHVGNSGLIEDHVQDITFDDVGGTWFATLGGVSHLDSSAVWTSYTTADGLPSNSIREICHVGSGVIWVVTDAGAAIFETGAWTAYTQEDGLGDNNVNAVELGYDDYVWFGTNQNGISSFGEATVPTPTVTPTPTIGPTVTP